jgi:hypothetical protein
MHTLKSSQWSVSATPAAPSLDMGVYRDYGKPEHDWRYIDELFDFLHHQPHTS